ncbi:MAG: hypothetical protein JWO62_2253, partial [Acidimicrobiaceae bacterium]|nr:hypothetical protein [Acidimicrobiaceae bacterium]
MVPDRGERPGHGVVDGHATASTTRTWSFGAAPVTAKQGSTSERNWQATEISDQPRGMVDGMATKKVTVTLEADQLDRIHTLVGSGAAPSVSG